MMMMMMIMMIMMMMMMMMIIIIIIIITIMIMIIIIIIIIIINPPYYRDSLFRVSAFLNYVSSSVKEVFTFYNPDCTQPVGWVPPLRSTGFIIPV